MDRWMFQKIRLESGIFFELFFPRSNFFSFSPAVPLPPPSELLQHFQKLVSVGSTILLTTSMEAPAGSLQEKK